jgi:hypothetical protein
VLSPAERKGIHLLYFDGLYLFNYL